jgi:hypothetical protein
LPHCLPLKPLSPSHLKQLREVSQFCFTYVYEVHQPYPITLISFLHPSPPTRTPPPHVPILQSCLLLLIFKLVFTGVSQCIPLWVCFTLIRSTLSIPLPHPFTSHPPFFSSVQYTCLRPLPSHLMVRILLTFYHSLFPFPLFLSSVEYSTVTNVFCI